VPNSAGTDDLDDPLGGRYRLLEQIGHGSMGTVHRARGEFLGRDVAIKIIATHAVDAVDLRRDDEEVKMLARLNHHSLVTLLDAGSVTGPQGPQIYLVMELIEGPDLRQHLTQGPMSARRVGQIGYDLADALDYVHATGVIHRDIKPANIVMYDYPNDAARVRAKLIDFGVAVLMEAPLAHGGIFIGTAAYVSPEQAKSEKLGPPTDIYSLGLVLLECLTGTTSYPGPPLQSALARLMSGPDIPVDLDPPWTDLLTAMTATEAADRPSAREVALVLEESTLAGEGRRRSDSTHLPPDEAARMEAVHRYQILDTPPDGAFDAVTALAARIFAVPMALVTVVDHDRIWFKSRHGVQVERSTGTRACARRPSCTTSRGSSRTPQWTPARWPTRWSPESSACSFTQGSPCVPATGTTWARCASWTGSRERSDPTIARPSKTSLPS